MATLKQKNGKITEATVSAILGSDPSQSRNDVMRSMVREWHGLTPEVTKNSRINCSDKQLTQAKNEFERRTGMVIDNGGVYQHPDNNQLSASISGFLSDDIVEIICYQPEDNTLFPNAQDYLMNHHKYYHMVQFKLHCTGAAICHFVIQTPQGIDSTTVTCQPNWMEENKGIFNQFLSDYLKIVNNEKLSKPYLTEREYNASNDQEWLALAQERIVLKAKLDALNKALKVINGQLTDFAKKKNCKVVGGGVQAFKTLRKGSIQYAKIPELSGVNMESYRKKDAEYWSVR